MLKINRFIKLSVILLTISTTAFAQGGGCFEIKSILVDACGSPEGENEMVLFEVGASPLNVSNLNVIWPNNSWNGLCQDASTATLTNSINQQIQGCGSVTEPVGGVLPANSKVLLITSTNVDITSNSFSTLNDNLIVLYQCAGNTSGHFANFSFAPGLRTLVMQFTGGFGCSDTATYDRTLLVNQFGMIGGFSFDNNGSFVEFDAAGNPTYLNNGCQVLSSGLSITGGPDVGICPGGSNTATLTGSGVGILGNPQWQGGTGTFNPSNALNTTYTPGAGETGIVVLTITANGACNTSVTDTVLVNIVSAVPSVSLSLTIDGILNSNVTDPSYFYNWYEVGNPNAIPGAFNPSFTPSINGCYFMILSTVGNCTSTSDTVCITNVGINDLLFDQNITVLNNPGSSPSLILNVLSNDHFKVELFDLFGRVVKQYQEYISSGQTEITPDYTNMADGVYVLKVSNNQHSYSVKLVLTNN